MVEHQAHPTGGAQALGHADPHFQLQGDLVWQDADQAVAAAQEVRADAYAQSRPQRRQLGDVAVAAKAEDLAGDRPTYVHVPRAGGGLAIEADHGVPLQGRHIGGNSATGQIGRGRVEPHLNHPDPPSHQRILGRPGHAQGDVGVSTAEIGLLVGDGQLHLDRRMVGVEGRQDRRQNLAADQFAGGDPDGSAGLGRSAGHVAHVLQPRLQFEGQLRWLQSPGRAEEERRPQALLQGFDVTSDGGLGDPAGAGGGRQAAGFQDGVQTLKQVPVGGGDRRHG